MRAGTYRRIGASTFAPLSAREEDLGRGAPEASATARHPARRHGAGRAWCRGTLLGPGARLGHAALCALLAVDRRDGGGDPHALSSPRRRLAVVRPRSC